MNFDFKCNKQHQHIILEKKSIIPKLSKFKLFPSGFNMSLSLSRLPSAFWSIAGLIIAVIAIHFKIENAAWAIPVSCLLYYSSNKIVPFCTMLIALAGILFASPAMILLLVFSVITMIEWSEIT